MGHKEQLVRVGGYAFKTAVCSPVLREVIILQMRGESDAHIHIPHALQLIYKKLHAAVIVELE